MDLALIASITSSLLFLVSVTWYVVDVSRGNVRVAVVSVFMLTLINLSQLGALIAKELWYIIPFAVVAPIMNLLIIYFGIRNAKYQFKKLDAVILSGALVGLLVWYITGEAAYNIYILTAVMLVSIIPMVSKTFSDPSSETVLPWRINLASTVIFLFTITSLAPEAWLVQVRALVFSILMNLALSHSARLSRFRRRAREASPTITNA